MNASFHARVVTWHFINESCHVWTQIVYVAACALAYEWSTKESYIAAKQPHVSAKQPQYVAALRSHIWMIHERVLHFRKTTTDFRKTRTDFRKTRTNFCKTTLVCGGMRSQIWMTYKRALHFRKTTIFFRKRTSVCGGAALSNMNGSCHVYPPKNGLIALWPNTRVVQCKYSVSPKQNGFNNKVHWYNIFLTFIDKFTDWLSWTKISVLSNLSNWQKTTWQY